MSEQLSPTMPQEFDALAQARIDANPEVNRYHEFVGKPGEIDPNAAEDMASFLEKRPATDQEGDHYANTLEETDYSQMGMVELAHAMGDAELVGDSTKADDLLDLLTERIDWMTEHNETARSSRKDILKDADGNDVDPAIHWLDKILATKDKYKAEQLAVQDVKVPGWSDVPQASFEDFFEAEEAARAAGPREVSFEDFFETEEAARTDADATERLTLAHATEQARLAQEELGIPVSPEDWLRGQPGQEATNPTTGRFSRIRAAIMSLPQRAIDKIGNAKNYFEQVSEDPSVERRKKLIKVGIGAAALAVAGIGVYALAKGVDTSSADSNGDVAGAIDTTTTSTTSVNGSEAPGMSGFGIGRGGSGAGAEAASEVTGISGHGIGRGASGDVLSAPTGQFAVEQGHGYTHEIMDFANTMGVDLTPDQALEAYEQLHDKFGDNLIEGVNSYTMPNGDLGISAPGMGIWGDAQREALEEIIKQSA